MVVAGSGPVLALSGISHGFSRGRSKSWVQVLRDADLELELGEVVAVVGGRLSGKTTLLRIAAGLNRPDSGTVRLCEVELTELRERDRERIRDQEVLWLSRVGISQKVEVSKIVSWMLPRAARRKGDRRVAELLDRVGAAGCAGRRWRDLSSWEQVLVAFAQAFAAPPTLIVIDDLLDALGEPATRQAFDLLRMLIEDAGRSCGVLISASDMDAALGADRVWSLESGRLIPTIGHRRRHAEVVPLKRRAQTSE